MFVSFTVWNGIGRGTSYRSCCQFCPCNLTQTNKWYIIWRLSAVLPQAILLPYRGKYSLSSRNSRDASSPSYTQNGNLKLVGGVFWLFFFVSVCVKKALHGRPAFHCYPFQLWGRPCRISTRGWRTLCARRPREPTPSCGWRCQLKQQSSPVVCSSKVRSSVSQCTDWRSPACLSLGSLSGLEGDKGCTRQLVQRIKAFLKVVWSLNVRVSIVLNCYIPAFVL